MHAMTKPWFREPWPWILMAGPFIVVIAGLVTAWIAVRSNDGLVTEDYYKKGLSVNQTIAQSELAGKLGIKAAVKVTSERLTVALSASATTFAPPSAIRVTISHPTRAGLDQSELLARSGDGYSGSFRLPAAGHWLVLIEDEARTWRLLGNVILPAAGPTVIGGTMESADIRN